MALSIDYPWPAERDAEQTDIDKRGRSMRNYPEMAIPTGEKLFKSKEFRALIAPDCTVYFWTTNFHMEEAFVLLNAMGFAFHSTIGTWVKNKMGRGQVLRGQTEHCIIATCGKPTINLTNQTTAWQGAGWDVREDSRKPDAFYAMVEDLTPAPRYAEIFSRGGRNEKWDCHGDQAGEFTPAPAKAAPKPKSVRRTLPGRNAKLISFAEKHGHIVSMTIDAATNESVGTCACGFEHREHRDELAQDDPEGIKLRIARAKAMDAVVTEHWREQCEAQSKPTADEPAATVPAGNGDKSAKSAAIPAGDSEQLKIPGFLDRNAPAAEAAE
jgi:N6-adenosine-specific RNA methylase IME4